MSYAGCGSGHDVYQILTSLGEGGMGAAYKARDLEVDRLVAVKVILPELASRPNILQRFEQEPILTRQVTHRNVVRIFDLGVADNVKFHQHGVDRRTRTRIPDARLRHRSKRPKSCFKCAEAWKQLTPRA